jgi:hypothetical protein
MPIRDRGEEEPRRQAGESNPFESDQYHFPGLDLPEAGSKANRT